MASKKGRKKATPVVDVSKMSCTFLDLRNPRPDMSALELCRSIMTMKDEHFVIDPNYGVMTDDKYKKLLSEYNSLREKDKSTSHISFPAFYQPGVMELFHHSYIDCLVRSNKTKYPTKPANWPSGVAWGGPGHGVQKLNRLCHRRDLRKLVINPKDNLVCRVEQNSKIYTYYILGPQNISPYTGKGLIRDAWNVAFDIGFENRIKNHIVFFDKLVGVLNNVDGIMPIKNPGDGYYFAYPNQFVFNWGFFKDQNGTFVTHDEIRDNYMVDSCVSDKLQFQSLTIPFNYQSERITKSKLIERLSTRLKRKLTDKEATDIWYNLSETCLRQDATSFWVYGLPNLQVMMPLVGKYGINTETGQLEKEIEIHINVRDVSDCHCTAKQAQEQLKADMVSDRVRRSKQEIDNSFASNHIDAPDEKEEQDSGVVGIEN